MLDDLNVITQRDPAGALKVASQQALQVGFQPAVVNAEHDGRKLKNIVIAGMGGSALAALLIKTWQKQQLDIPLEIVRDYNLPAYVDQSTLVICDSYSGNTEETLSALNEARQKGAQVGVVAAGGELIKLAQQHQIAHVLLAQGLQPRMAVIFNLKALLALMINFGVLDQALLGQISQLEDWLCTEVSAWQPDVSVDKNFAKQLALMTVGKVPVIYGGAISAPVAYKWKISWNENAKNVAFWNEYPEFNHNEFLGWTSHPIEKPFAVFDLISKFEHDQIKRRFEISDRLLSGKRPKAFRLELAGDSILAELLWGSILADFASIYTAILNGVDPTPVPIIAKLKDELK